MAQQFKPEFKVENNVLIGKPVHIAEEGQNVGELILQKLNEKPDFIGEVEACTGKQRTLREIRERSVKCAIWLKRQGIRPGDIIGICVDNNIDTSVPIYASMYVAGVISGWDHELSVTSARFFLSLISPKLVFINAPSASNLKQAAKEENMDIRVIVLGEAEGFDESLTDILETVDSSEVDEFRCTPIEDPKSVAMISWSSGTTGLPKGTEISHRSIICAASPIEDVNIIDEVVTWTPTIRWHFGLLLMIESILSNAQKVLLPDIDEDVEIIQYINKYGVTYFTCDPCVPMRWVKYGVMEKYSVPSLRKFVVSGAHFRAQSQETLTKLLPHTQILQCYGMTDAGGLCICQARNSKPGACGFVTKGIQLKVVDTKTGLALGPNKTGEIWLKSPSVMNGYHKNPEATKQVLDEEGWLHTKDLGYYDVDGNIFVVDRLSDFINYRSINLSPAEIETVLETHPSVLKAAVVPVSHEIDEQHPMAFITRVPNKQVTEEELLKLVEKTLPWYCHLRAGLKFLDKFPYTPTGKVSKKELRTLAEKLSTNQTTIA